MDPQNFLVQRLSPAAARVRVIDNLGSPVKIPLFFYIDVLARRRVRRYWNRFLREVVQNYPAFFRASEVKALRL